MPITTGELITNIEDSQSFPEVEEWRRYLMANKEYYQSDMREIIDILTDAEIRYSPGCPTRLTFTYYGERGGLQFYTPSQDEITRFCKVSKRKGVSLIRVIYDTFPDLAKYTTIITRSSEVYEKYYRRPPPEELGPPPIEKEFAEEMERRPRKPHREEYYPEEEREEIQPVRKVERKVEYLKPEIEPSELIRPYEERIEELEEELRHKKIPEKHETVDTVLSEDEYRKLIELDANREIPQNISFRVEEEMTHDGVRIYYMRFTDGSIEDIKNFIRKVRD